MTGGRTYLLIGSCLIGAACTPDNQVHVRALSDRGASNKTDNALLAQARAQLAMGSVGLALENFRSLQIEQGDSVETFEGIAACYAAMGRYDLTRTNLEFALAYAPNDPGVLNEYSAALERLGERAQANEVRAEAERLQVAAATMTVAVQRDLTPIGVARVGSVTVKLPELTLPAEPKDNRSSPAVPNQPANLPDMHVQSLKTTDAQASELPPAQSRVQTAGPVPAAKPQSSATKTAAIPVAEQVVPHWAPVSARRSDLQAQKPDTALVPTFDQTPTENATKTAVELAVAKTVFPPDRGRRFQGPSPQERAVDEPRPQASASPEIQRENAPHLERISPNEVALFIVSPKRKWSNIKIAEANARSNALSPVPLTPFPSRQTSENTLAVASLRWVPLKSSAAENVQLLNAARRQGLAADARATLLGRGWRKVGIGNATMVRAHTLVLYGKSRTQLAYRLAAQFRCKAKKVVGLKKVIVLLGRDASRRQSLSERV